MALVKRNQFKRSVASTSFTLAAQPNESLLIRDIFCLPSTNDSYLTLYTNNRTVGKFRVKTLSGNHLPAPQNDTASVYEGRLGTIIDQLRRAGLAQLGKPAMASGGSLEDWRANPYDLSFPVAPGETFTVARYAEAGNVIVKYDVYDDTDLKSTDPNGSNGLVTRYLHYITNIATTASIDHVVSTSLLWTGGDGWPVNGLGVAENVEIALLAIAAGAHGKGASATNKGYSTFLKLIQSNTVLGDKDNNGYPFLGDVSALSAAGYGVTGSVIGDGTAEHPAPPLIFDPPIVFTQGMTLGIYETIAGWASGGPGAGELGCALALQRTQKA